MLKTPQDKLFYNYISVRETWNKVNSYVGDTAEQNLFPQSPFFLFKWMSGELWDLDDTLLIL